MRRQPNPKMGKDIELTYLPREAGQRWELRIPEMPGSPPPATCQPPVGLPASGLGLRLQSYLLSPSTTCHLSPLRCLARAFAPSHLETCFGGDLLVEGHVHLTSRPGIASVPSGPRGRARVRAFHRQEGQDGDRQTPRPVRDPV